MPKLKKIRVNGRLKLRIIEENLSVF